MSEDFDRRQALKGIVGTVVGGSLFGGIVGCSGDGGDGTSAASEQGAAQKEASGGGAAKPNHKVPHPKDGTVPEVEATGKTLAGAKRSPGAQSAKDNPSVMLQHTPNGKQACGNCSLYVPDQDGDGFGACASVKGKIHPCDWCVLYTEYSGKGVASCAQV
ncbi:MAG: hypothetical protein ABEK84_11060 [Salinibacter sp.]